MKRLRIILVEHSPIIVEGLTQMLAEALDLDLVKAIPDTTLLEDVLNAHRTDILLINTAVSGLSLPHLLHGVRQLYPDMTVVGLHTAYTDASLLKHFDSLIELEDNQQTVCTKLRESTFAERKEEGVDNSDLSQREKEVLVLVAKGKINKEIADSLNLSIHTVMTHRKNITRKTGIKSISGLTVYALLNNLIGEGEVI
ncbi:MAG TPA: response regulator transcription factor [Paludibacteraceae bacterium]|nr:response regulator transcription factor [Paludibacteraceae bacterium]HQF49409.1 response regulator transcription factor [Paludibacteraceae bacterium]HQJ89839.1 response regulator transcription factor [Paludibacteraceae bacterium]